MKVRQDRIRNAIFNLSMKFSRRPIFYNIHKGVYCLLLLLFSFPFPSFPFLFLD